MWQFGTLRDHVGWSVTVWRRFGPLLEQFWTAWSMGEAASNKTALSWSAARRHQRIPALFWAAVWRWGWHCACVVSSNSAVGFYAISIAPQTYTSSQHTDTYSTRTYSRLEAEHLHIFTCFLKKTLSVIPLKSPVYESDTWCVYDNVKSWNVRQKHKKKQFRSRLWAQINHFKFAQSGKKPSRA